MKRRATWRTRIEHAAVCLLALMLGALPVAAQQGPINPRIPPPPPQAPQEPGSPPQTTTPGAPPSFSMDLPLPPARRPAPPMDLPKRVQIPAGTRLNVVLDTPMSTRISKTGQLIKFHMEDSYRASDALQIPPETEISGSVVEARKPGTFGKPGVLRVKVDSMHLTNGAGGSIVARLDSPDMKGNGRLQSDSTRTTNLASLAMWTLEGTLVGDAIHGGKGAAVGAGAGALAAILISMSKRGQDLYLEPGMPFTVILDQPLELAGADVYNAQQDYASTHPNGSGSRSRDRDSVNSSSDPGRPKLKRRPNIP
jgi:hypothetical protein